MGHFQCLGAPKWAWAPPFFISKLKFSYDKYSVDKVWTKIYCHFYFRGITLSLCKHACKEVCDFNPGIDPYPLLARSCDRWWPDFVTFTACERSRFGLKRGKKVQCLSNTWKDLFEWKKYFGVRCTLNTKKNKPYLSYTLARKRQLYSQSPQKYSSDQMMMPE